MTHCDDNLWPIALLSVRAYIAVLPTHRSFDTGGTLWNSRPPQSMNFEQCYDSPPSGMFLIRRCVLSLTMALHQSISSWSLRFLLAPDQMMCAREMQSLSSAISITSAQRNWTENQLKKKKKKKRGRDNGCARKDRDWKRD